MSVHAAAPAVSWLPRAGVRNSRGPVTTGLPNGDDSREARPSVHDVMPSAAAVRGARSAAGSRKLVRRALRPRDAPAFRAVKRCDRFRTAASSGRVAGDAPGDRFGAAHACPPVPTSRSSPCGSTSQSPPPAPTPRRQRKPPARRPEETFDLSDRLTNGLPAKIAARLAGAVAVLEQQRPRKRAVARG